MAALPTSRVKRAPTGRLQPGPHGHPQATVAVAFVVLLLVLATTSQGAFAVSRWAPLALFALAILLGALLARDGFAFRPRSVVVALAGIWGLAAWSMLSMLWAKSSGDAFVAGDRTILYAAIATLPFVLPLVAALAGGGRVGDRGRDRRDRGLRARQVAGRRGAAVPGRTPERRRSTTATPPRCCSRCRCGRSSSATAARATGAVVRAVGAGAGNAVPGAGVPDPVARDPARARRRRVPGALASGPTGCAEPGWRSWLSRGLPLRRRGCCVRFTRSTAGTAS